MGRVSIVDFIKLMKIDLIIMLFTFGYVIQGVTVTQLMEDKMCLNQLNRDHDYCSALTKSHYNESSTKLILRTANLFKNYQFVILNGPALILSVFLGYWLGNYPNYIRLMITLPLGSACCTMIILLINSYFYTIHYWYILLSYVPLALTGGVGMVYSAAYTYVSWSTPSNLVIIRFAIIEFLVQISLSSGTYAGGFILDSNPWIKGQPKNYIGVFILGLISQIIGLIYASTVKLDHIPETEDEKKSKNFIDVIKDVFLLSRLKQFVNIFMKKRPNHGRLWLILLLTSGAISVSSILGEDGIAYQFAQRVYGLTEDQYTSIFSLVTLVPSFMTSLAPSFFRSLLGLSDSIIGIIGSLSMLSFFLIRGIILIVPGYIIGFLTGSFNRLPASAVRSLVTTIVDPTETAQVFTLSIALESYGTLGFTLLYTSVFSLTIDSAPGTIMILIACIQLYPISVFFASLFKRSQWKIKPNDDQGKCILLDEDDFNNNN